MTAMKRPLAFAVLFAVAACSSQAAKAVDPPSRTDVVDDVTAPPARDLPAGDYTLDKPHASLIFRFNHMGLTHYTARFTAFDATLHLDPAHPERSSVTASVDPRSLALNAPPAGFLDQILGPTWLNVAAFPTMTFRSTKVELTGPKTATVTGDLTLHGVTLPVALDVTFNGGYAQNNMDPHSRLGFTATGNFKRSAFGIPPGRRRRRTIWVSANIWTLSSKRSSRAPLRLRRIEANRR